MDGSVDVEGFTYQPSSPVGLTLKLPKRALPRAPEEPLGMVPERLSFRASSGAVSPVLGPALKGCPVDRCVRLIGEPF